VAPHGKNTDFVVPDTNFWVNVHESLGSLDWHRLLEQAKGRSDPSGEDIRIVVPLLVIDELDGLGHKSDKRAKVSGVNKYLYSLLGDDPGVMQEVQSASGGHGDVTMQLLFEPLGHIRLANSDDELVERVVVLRDFVGLAAQRVFFLTYDGGAALRSTNAGLMTRHVAPPPRGQNGG
jgi:rRNA-processing protein FCF1